MAVFVSIDGSPIGALLMGDELRREAPSAIQALRASGIKRLVMVTGDRAESAETMAAALDLDAVLAERVPSDKVDAVKVERRTAAVMMVGDGINDAPALAAADVGVAMGARGASASSQAADVVILTDRLDRICDAVRIARRTYRIATQSVLVGLGLSAATMAGAAAGVLSPVACALIQEAIDVAVILNALRALGSGMQWSQPRMSNEHALALRHDHQALEADLDRLRTITDALDAAAPDRAAALIIEAETIVRERIVVHERDDEAKVYPYLTRFLSDGHGLSAMSRAHREIIHLSRLLGRLRGAIEEDGSPLDEFAIRDGQRVIESVEALVRLHNAQEEDIYDHASAS
jgi:soluble P-type ATPase